MSRWLPFASAALVLGGVAVAGAIGAQATPDPAPTVSPAAPPYGDVPWAELSFSAHKFFLGASTSIRLESVDAATAAGALRPAAVGRSVAVGSDGAAAIAVDTRLPFGRDEVVRLLFDPATGAALGGEKTALGGSAYRKVFRYTEGGLFTWRTAPADGREAALPQAAWTQRKSSLVAPAVAPPPGTPVADSYALIYLVSAAHLERRDASARIVMLADDRFVDLTFTAGGLTRRTVAFEEEWPGGHRRRDGAIVVRQVRATATALGAAGTGEDVDLGFLGMRGALTVYLEVGTDIPVALTGRVEHIGELTVRLDRAVLRRAPPAAAAP